MDFKASLESHEDAVAKLKNGCIETIEKMANICCEAIRSGHKLLICGNGGSAADSQHIAAEFVGRFIKERRGLPAIALTTDTSILTALGNDYGYENIFCRQVEALGNAGDVLLGISTSGNSKNIVAALLKAKNRGLHCIAFTGYQESEMNNIAEYTLRVPSLITARVQECHILVGHLICEYVDEEYMPCKVK